MASVQPGNLNRTSRVSDTRGVQRNPCDAVFREFDNRSPSPGANNQVTRVAERPGKLNVLETVRQVHQLTSAESGRHYPVHLRGVVTFHTPGWDFAFLQDLTGGIFINTSESDLDLKPGQLVELHGQSGPGEFAPVVEHAKLRVLGESALPVAPRLSIDENVRPLR